MKQFFDYLRYSGVSITFNLNPFHWHFIPRTFKSDKDAWDTDAWSVSFLFLTIRFWIDDGSW
jgi:hypothetical protein